MRVAQRLGDRGEFPSNRDQMNVVAHQAIRPDRHFEPSGESIEQVEVGSPIVVVTKDGLAVVAAMRDVKRPVISDLQSAKRELELPRVLRKLDHFELLILDDIGYTRQSPEDAEVLFTLMAERYERRSLMITSNLLFSKWNRIFQNEMTTAAAIDRLVHHSVVLEFDVESFRGEEARKKGGKRRPTAKTAKR